MIENVNGTNVKNIKPNKVSASVKSDKQTPTAQTKENGNKLLYASLAGLATLTAAGVYAIKTGKFSGGKNYCLNGILHEQDGCKFFFKKGKLYNETGSLATEILKKESKNGNKLYSYYKDGVCVKRVFSPADKSDVIEISKNFNSVKVDGVKTVKTIIRKTDGTFEYKFVADFAEKKFPPEVESKIKMQDFDNLKLEDINFLKKDLGGGVVLARSVGDGVKLRYNGKIIRRKYINNNSQTIINKNGVQITKDGDNFCEMTMEKLDEINIYHSDGTRTMIKTSIDKDGKQITITNKYNINGDLTNSDTNAL